MKHLLASTIALSLLSSYAVSQETAPFSLTHYGRFQKMMHMKNTDGVVDLGQAANQPSLYGVGALAHGTGEITLVNGKLWLDYGADGLGNAKHDAAKDEKAVLLVTAQVNTWVDVAVPEDMNGEKMHDFILAQASLHGIDTGTAFPFSIEGAYFDLDWHILNGRKEGGGHGLGGLFHKINEHRAQTAGTVVGFYSAAEQGVFTHPGESWHLHIVFESQGMAGHIDAISLRKGAILKLPAG